MKLNLIIKLKSFIGVFVILIPLTIAVHAQSIKRQSVSSYGSSSITENVLISQTAGQSFNTDVSLIGVTVSQGFQQPITYSVKDISTPAIQNLNISIYPNPTRNSVTISSKEEIERAFIAVSDINGKYFFSEKVPNLSTHTIYIGSWSNGVYLITIYDSANNKKTLRLIISK